MPNPDQPSHHPGKPARSPARDPARPTNWLWAAVCVSLAGALILAAFGMLLAWSPHAAQLSLAFHLENVSYLFISFFGLGLVATLPVCLVARLLGTLLRRTSLRTQQLSLATSAFCAGLIAVLAWVVAFFTSTLLPDGATGVLLTLGAALILLIPVAWLVLKVGRTFIGRLLAPPTRWLGYLGLAVLLGSIAVTLVRRPQPRAMPEAWPPTSHTATVADARPNIVLIVFDALRADRLGCYGCPTPTSPHIDAFAARSVLYDKAISSGAWTVPSHASLFTGLAATQHGARFGLDRLWLADSFVTLAELLRDNGYETIALSNNPIVSPLTNLTQGFELTAVPRDMMTSARMVMLPFYVRALGRIGPAASLLGRWFIEDPGGRATNDIAARWLAQRDADRPFFLFINYMETHDPYQPPPPYRRLFVAPDDTERSYWSGLNDDTLRWPYALAGAPHYSERDLQIFSNMYDARVREADDRFAELIETLAATTDLGNTIVVVTSDHGENLGEHGLIGHQFSLHNTLIHMPLIVHWPKRLSAQRVDRLVQVYDLFPSLLAWSGTPVKQTARVEARLLPTTLTPTTAPGDRLAVAEYLFWTSSELDMVKKLVPDFDPAPWRTAYRAVLDDRWKLLAHLRRDSNQVELFNWLTDPLEERNLATIQPIERARLAAALGQWLKATPPFDPNRFDQPPDRSLQKEQHQRLRDLGYAH